MLQMGQAAVYPAAGASMGVWTIGGAWGLPAIGSFPLPKLRLELPILEHRTGMELGSTLATVGVGRTFSTLGSLRLGVSVDVGLLAPSPGGQTIEVAGKPLAEPSVLPYYAGSLPLTLPRLGLGLVVSTTSFAPVDVELDFTAPGRAVLLRAGAGPPVSGHQARWFSGIGLPLGAFVELGASATVVVDPPKAAILEVSARWSVPSAATRTKPWDDADARVLHPQDVEGRTVEAFGVPGKFTIVEVGAEWCPPCLAARPTLRALARRPGVAVRLIDLDECPVFAARYGVSAVPVFFLVDASGRLASRITGWNESVMEHAVPP